MGTTGIIEVERHGACGGGTVRRRLGILAITGLVVVGCGNGDTSQPDARPAPTSGPITTGAPPGSQRQVDAPATAAVVTSAVSVVDAHDGEVVAQLDSPRLSGRAVGFSGVAVHPAGDALYAVAVINAHRSEIHRLGFEGGSELVAVGADVAVSPDGRSIAYSRTTDARDGRATARREDLVVQDLTTGTERRWENAAPTDPDLTADLGSLSWSSDSRSVAFHIRFEDGVEVRILDIDEGGSVLDGHRVMPPEGSAFAWPAYRGRSGALAVVEQRGGPDPSIAPERFAIVDVDDSTGDVRATLAHPARPVIGLDFDVTGQHLLVLTGHHEHGSGRGQPNRLLRWSGGDLEPVPLESEPVSAAW